jgi:hypothetical protein
MAQCMHEVILSTQSHYDLATQSLIPILKGLAEHPPIKGYRPQ